MQEAIDALADAKMMSRAARKQNKKSLRRMDYCIRQSGKALRLLEANLGCGKKIVKAMLGEANFMRYAGK